MGEGEREERDVGQGQNSARGKQTAATNTIKCNPNRFLFDETFAGNPARGYYAHGKAFEGYEKRVLGPPGGQGSTLWGMKSATLDRRGLKVALCGARKARPWTAGGSR